MIKHIPPALRPGLVATVVALMPLTEATATGFAGILPPIAANTAPLARSCGPFTLGPGKTVTIIAGPANATTGDTTQAANFPAKVSNATDLNCPATPGQCLKWEYKWIYTGVTPSLSFVTLDSDLALWEAKGGWSIFTQGRVSVPPYDDLNGVGDNVAELRTVRFSANSSNSNSGTFNAALYTGLEARVGKVTAGFLNGLQKGFCAMQGAENAPGGDYLQSQSKTITTNTLGCKVDWTLSADGCVTAAALNPLSQGDPPQSCQITTPTISGPSGALIGATCGAEISVPGSTTTCRWNSIARTNLCVTVP
jgi:hypothetical protein